MEKLWKKGWLVNLHLKGNKFGSGILINDQGFILTAFHNVYDNTLGEHIIEKVTPSLNGTWHQEIFHISGKNNITVQCPDKSLARKIDLIAIKAEGTSFTRSPLQIATELPKENDTVILLIYDLNNSKHNYWREEEATVGPLFYEHGFCFFSLHKVNGIDGASGGGVFTQDGKLLGIIKQTRTDTQDYIAIFLGDKRLQSLIPPTSSSNSYADKPSTSEQPIPSITFNTPKIIDIGVNELKALIPKIEILLLTVNKWERKALLSEMTPIDGKDGILQGALDKLTYRIGMFGNYCAAYTESTMGSGGRQGATLTAERAINELKPKAVLLLGIAFGIDSSEQKLGDVLIAESIQPYEFQKVHNDFSITYRGQATPCGNILSERFRMRRDDWTPKHGDKSFDDVKVYQGLVLSGDKLVNNKDFRDALVKAFPTSIGGEMEGAGAYSAVSSPVEVILIKSICDWADGDKNDKAQPFAAFTAVSLAKHVLTKPDVLHPLITATKQVINGTKQALNETFLTSSINILEKLTKEEYGIDLKQLVNQFDINQQKTILQFTRLLGVMLKEPFSNNYNMQPSERTGAIRGWQWDIDKFVLPNAQGHWQYKVIEALYKESYSQSSITQEIKITAIQQFISNEGSTEGRMSLILLKSIENHICSSTLVKAQIEQALQGSSDSSASIIPTAIGLSLCSIIASAVPYGSSLGPLVGGVAILLSKIGLNAFCNWVKQHTKSEALSQEEQIEQRKISTAPSTNQIDNLKENNQINMNQIDKFELVNKLLKCPCIINTTRRRTVISQLGDTIRSNVSEASDSRTEVTNVVEACLMYPDGLKSLINAVRFFDRGTFVLNDLENFLKENKIFL